MKAEIDRHGLTMLDINTPPAAAGGEPRPRRGAGARADFAALFAKALDYVVAIGGTLDPRAGRHRAAGAAAGGRERCSSPISRAPPTWRREKNITLLIEPLNQRDRPDYFLTRVEHVADIIAKVGKPNVRIQFDFYHVQIDAAATCSRGSRSICR